MQRHKRFRHSLLSSLACLLLLLLSACSSTSGNNTQSTTKAPADKQIYNYPLLASDISTFDPGQGTDLNSIAAIDMVFTGLVQLDDNLQVRPQLASSYQKSTDGLTYMFTLKPGLKFSDGTQLTSKDVVYSIDRALSPEISSLNGVSLTYLGLIKDSEKRVNGKIPTLINDSLIAPNDNTVIIKLNKATAYFLEALTYPTSYVVEKSVIDKWKLKWTDHLSDNGGQGGAGPFVVKKYDHNTGIQFAPNPNYYGPKPQLQTVNFPFYKDDSTAYEAYLAGQVDQAPIPSAHLAQAKTRKSEFRTVPSLWINYYGLNYLVKPFDNIHIRQALDLALDKDAIVRAVWQNKYIPTNHIVPKGMPGYNPDLKGPDGTTNTSGNVALAKKLFQQGLQEEGLTLATFPNLRFTYSNKSADTANDVVTAIGMWKNNLGITSIKPDPVDPTKLFSEITNTSNNTSLQMWRVDWIADYADAQDWLTLQFDKGAPNNNVNYGQNNSSDATIQQQTQQLMEQADVETNSAKRIQEYNQAEQQLINDVAWLPMQQETVDYLLKPYVKGVIDNAGNLTPPDDWSNVYIVQH